MKNYLLKHSIHIIFAAVAILKTPALVAQKNYINNDVLKASTAELEKKKAFARKYNKMSGQLLNIIEIHESKGLAAAVMYAKDSSMHIEANKIIIIVECSIYNKAEIVNDLKKQKAEVISEYENILKVSVDIANLKNLNKITKIKNIRQPEIPKTFTVDGEHTGLTKASNAIALGANGSGVKVAVIDAGFINLSAAVTANELPSGTINIDYSGSGHQATTEHGTACAEVIYEMASNCQLYLIKVSSLVDLGNAKDYCKVNGINIISASIGWTLSSWGDGQGTACDIVNDANNYGILWFNAAGNYGQRHYQATLTPIADYHNFSGGNTLNQLGWLPAGSPIYIELKWNDTWGASGNDYDLYIYTNGGTMWVLYAGSEAAQNGNDNPVESIGFNLPKASYVGVAVYKYSGVNKEFQLFSSYEDFQYITSAKGLCTPADATGAITVGAIPYSNYTAGGPIADYSSLGPTQDNRIKPDISGVTEVNNYIYGRFSGTSCSTPSAAGAAAVLWSAYSSYTSAGVLAALTNHAIDCGAAGKDNTFGFGKISVYIPISGVPGTVYTSIAYTNSTTVTFNWTAGTVKNNSYVYYLQISSNMAAPYIVDTEKGSSLFHTENSLEHAKTYYARICATNLYEQGTWSSWASCVTIDTQPPTLSSAVIHSATNGLLFGVNIVADDSGLSGASSIISGLSNSTVKTTNSYSLQTGITVPGLDTVHITNIAISFRDNAGNESGNYFLCVSNYDNDPTPPVPAVSLTLPAAGSWSKLGVISIIGNITENGSSLNNVAVFTNGIFWVDASISGSVSTGWVWSNSIDTAELTNGTNLITIYTTNSGVTPEGVSYSYDLLIDKINPAVPAFVISITNDHSILMEFSGTDTLSGIAGYNITNYSNNTCFYTADTNYTIDMLIDDTAYTLGVCAVDQAGNYSSWTNISITTPDDTNSPYILSMTSSKANGSYTVGTEIDILLNFSEYINLTGGSMALALNSGKTVEIPVSAVYSKTLSAEYTVAAGENTGRLDVSSYSFNGGIIRDLGSLQLVTTPAYTKLKENKNIVIDTRAPAVKVISGPSADYTSDSVFSVTLSADESSGYWSTNSGAFNSFSGQAVITIDAPVKFSFYGKDALGNQSSTVFYNYVVNLIRYLGNDQLTRDWINDLTKNRVQPEIMKKISTMAVEADGSAVQEYLAHQSSAQGKIHKAAATLATLPGKDVMIFSRQKDDRTFEKIEEIGVYNKEGRLLYKLSDSAVNTPVTVWNKKDSSGRLLPNGFYILRIKYAGGTDLTHIIILDSAGQ